MLTSTRSEFNFSSSMFCRSSNCSKFKLDYSKNSKDKQELGLARIFKCLLNGDSCTDFLLSIIVSGYSAVH